MIRRIVAATALIAAATGAQAALTPAEIVDRHVAAVAKSDVEALLADYADDAVVLQAGKAVQGKPAIRALLTRMFPHPLAAGEAPTGAAAMQIKRKWSEGDVGFFDWAMGARAGTDEFRVKNGKIEVQAVFFTPPAP